MNKTITVKVFLPVILSTLFLTVLIPQVFSQEKTSNSSLQPIIDSTIQELNSAVRQVTTQEGLAQRIFDTTQKAEETAGYSLYEGFIPPFLDNQPNVNKVLDHIEERWLSFPVDDYYDDVGVFLMWGNIVTGRFDKADTLFTKMRENLLGKGIDPYFYGYSIMKNIDEISLGKKFFIPREDLSLLYAAKMIGEMYSYQNKRDKFLEAYKLISDNYKGTKGTMVLDAVYQYKKAEFKYGSRESIPEEERRQLNNNIMAALEEMKKISEMED